jgi:hypothetical protein
MAWPLLLAIAGISFGVGHALSPATGSPVTPEFAFTNGTNTIEAIGTWQVTATRHDPYILAHPIINEVPKGAGQLLNPGECLYEPLCR